MKKCFVVHIKIKNQKNKIDHNYKLQETINLSKALNLEVAGSCIYNLSDINPATLINKGNLENLKISLESLEVDALIINYLLTPIQQRNLENYLKVKVIDRHGLIINIFALRAKSKEGKLQSELASLYYQKSRLVKAWSHLERQRGGGGAVGGPGETQKELDRRMISKKIDTLKVKLQKVKGNRVIQSTLRKKNGLKVIALVGYTNSGKSTLFNSLTVSEVFADDLLFATLDPTLRTIKPDNKQKALLSDTVGFISDIPHQLIEAFHSTLDEVREADLILHIIDISQEYYEDQINSVKEVLNSLGISEEIYNSKTLEVYNKSDLLTDIQIEEIIQKKPTSIIISALNNINLNQLKEKISYFINKDLTEITFKVPHQNNELAIYLYNKALIVKSQCFDRYTELTALCSDENIQHIEQHNLKVKL